MKSEVVRASTGRKVTDGMKEWWMLQWYEMAAFAVVRGRCCSAPPPLTLPAPIGECVPLDRALDRLGAAARDADDVERALAEYTRAVHCAVSSGHGGTYGHPSRPKGGEEAAIRKTLARGSKPSGRDAGPSEHRPGGDADRSGPTPAPARAAPSVASKPAAPKPRATAARPAADPYAPKATPAAPSDPY